MTTNYVGRAVLCAALMGMFAACDRNESTITEPGSQAHPGMEPSFAATLEGTHPTLEILESTTLTGDVVVNGHLNIRNGSVLNVRGYHLQVNGRIWVWDGALMMKQGRGQITTASIHQFSAHLNDSTYVTAGTITLKGRGAVGGIHRMSGTSLLVFDGDSVQTFQAYSLRAVRLDGDSAVRHQDNAVLPISGDLTINSGLFYAMAPQTHGTVNIAGGASFTASSAYIRGPVLNAGQFTSTNTTFDAGGSYTIPTGPNFTYANSVTVSGSTNATILGRLPTNNFTVSDGSSFDVGRDTVAANSFVGHGRTIMGNRYGMIDANSVTLYAADTAALSAGVIRLKGTNQSYVRAATGTHTVVMAGNDKQVLLATRLRNLTIASTDTATAGIFSDGMTVSGKLTVNSGVLANSNIVVLGPVVTDAASEVRDGTIVLNAGIAAAGIFSPSHAHFRQGGTLTVPTASNYQYQAVTIADGTAAAIRGNLSLTGNLSITESSSLNVSRYALTTPATVNVANGSSLFMLSGSSFVTAGSMNMSPGANPSGATAMSAGQMWISGSTAALRSTSGTFRLFMQNTAPSSVSSPILQNLDMRGTSSVNVNVQNIPGTATLRSGTWNNLSAVTVGNLTLLKFTTLSGGGITYTGTFVNKGTVVGPVPVQN